MRNLLFFAQQTHDYLYFWAPIFQLGVIGALILIGNTLRRKIPLLRRYLIPTGLLAGFIGLGLKYLFSALKLNLSGMPIIDEDYMHFITYHMLAIGFIALGLISATQVKKVKDGRALKSGAFIVGGYLIQGVLGVLLSVIVGLIFANSAVAKAPYSGIILPLGFGQGPGQAGNTGYIYETLTGEFEQYALTRWSRLWTYCRGDWNLSCFRYWNNYLKRRCPQKVSGSERQRYNRSLW